MNKDNEWGPFLLALAAVGIMMFVLVTVANLLLETGFGQ